jgi:hypothetical protein
LGHGIVIDDLNFYVKVTFHMKSLLQSTPRERHRMARTIGTCFRFVVHSYYRELHETSWPHSTKDVVRRSTRQCVLGASLICLRRYCVSCLLLHQNSPSNSLASLSARGLPSSSCISLASGLKLLTSNNPVTDGCHGGVMDLFRSALASRSLNHL